MRAMVFAAGLGSRLRPLTLERPKPAVPVGNRPLGWFTLDHLSRHGIERAVLNTHHLGEHTATTLEAVAPPGVELVFVHEEHLLGTGGGLRNAWQHLARDGEPIVIMNSDIVYGPDLTRAIAHHQKLDAVATMVLRPDPDVARFGAVEIDAGGTVRRLLGRPGGDDPALTALMFTGVHVLSARAFSALPTEGCIVAHSYRRWVDAGETVGGWVDDHPWRDLGTLRAYLDANLDLASGDLTWPGVQSSPAGDLVHEGAVVGQGAVLTDCVVGAGARISPGTRLSRCVVWDGSSVEHDTTDAVITPRGTVPVETNH